MAMEKSLVLLILALFLLLSSAIAESRPIIQTTETSPNAQSNEQLSSGLSSPLEETNYNVDDREGCEGSENEEKCLMRRSLAYHTDYIYTQDIDERP